MAIEIHLSSGSTYSWRVLLALEVKEIPYELKFVDFSKGEHKTPEYLKMNPRGKVPVMKDNGFIVYESLACLAYLEAKYPKRPIFGRNPEQVAEIYRYISEFYSYMDAPVMDVILPLYFGKGKEKAESVKANAAVVKQNLAPIEATLTNKHWIVGDEITVVDMIFFPAIMSLLRAESKPDAKPLDLQIAPIEKYYPGFSAWLKRIQALPNYERTYPPHWRNS